MGIHDREYYRDDPPRGFDMSRPRSLVTNLVIINLAIFVADAFTKKETQLVRRRDGTVVEVVVGRRLSSALALDADLAADPQNLWKSYQLLTAGFVHAPLGSSTGIWHVGMNMFVLWMFGREMEQKYGRAEFLRFYLIAIVFANLFWLLLHNLTRGSAGGVLGASGAVTAVLMLFVFNNPRRTLYLWGVLAMPAWVAGLLFVGLDLWGAMGRGEQVAYEAHLGGAAFGAGYFLLGLNFGRLWPRRLSFSSLRPRPKLKVHEPEEQQYRDLDVEGDRLLEKVSREGIESLSPSERRKLEAYSRRMQQKHER